MNKYNTTNKTVNKTFSLYNPQTWYSYTFKRYYCTMPHTKVSDYDLIESFKTESDFISHMKLAHNIDYTSKPLPDEPHEYCYIED